MEYIFHILNSYSTEPKPINLIKLLNINLVQKLYAVIACLDRTFELILSFFLQYSFILALLSTFFFKSIWICRYSCWEPAYIDMKI